MCIRDRGYVDHPAHWVDFFGLSGKGGHVDKAAQLAKNRKQGADGEKKVREIIQALCGDSFGSQMTVKVDDVTSRIDFIVNRGGVLEFIEVKTGNATLTKNQAVARDVLNRTSDSDKPGAVRLGASEQRSALIGKRQNDRISGRFHQIYADSADDIERLVDILLGTV